MVIRQSDLSKCLIRSLAIFLIYNIRAIEALVCPVPSLSGGSARNKTCPDFKADPSFQYCCTSKLPESTGIVKGRHGIFCCSHDEFEKQQSEEAQKELKEFLRNYLAIIIVAFLVSSGLIVVLTSVLCKKYRKCPMYNDRTVLAHSVQTTYRPVDTIPPKIYEAPPPYECFVPPPDQARNDWNCVLENDLNDCRRLPPTIQ